MWPEYIQSFLLAFLAVAGVCVFREISKMFVLSVKENVYSPCWPQEYLNNSTDSLKASVFISSKVTGLIDSAGKSSWQLQVPPGRARRDAGNVNFLLHISCQHFFVSTGKKEVKAYKNRVRESWSVRLKFIFISWKEWCVPRINCKLI